LPGFYLKFTAVIPISKTWSNQGLRKLPNAISQQKADCTRSVVILMLLIIACLLLDVLAIILFFRDALKPGVFLIMNSAQTGFWGAILIMNFVSVGMNGGAATLGFSIFIL
jgi:hypothetical protein